MRKAEWKQQQRRKAHEAKRLAAVADAAARAGVTPAAYLADQRRRALAGHLLREMGSFDQYGRVW